LHQDLADGRSIQTGIADDVFERAVPGGSMILFDYVDHRQAGGSVAGNREAHGVRGTVARETVTAAASITAVAELPLARLGRLNDIGRPGVASAAKGIAQG